MTFQKNIQKSLVVSSLFCALQLVAASDSKPYVACLTRVVSSQAENPIESQDVGAANSYVEKVLRAFAAKMPKFIETEIVKFTGITTREMQTLKTQIAEGRAFFNDDAESEVTQKLKVVRNSFYAFHPQDDKLMVVMTPEGSVLEVKISQKGIFSEEVSLKFALKDSLRNYYFSINKNVIWFVDTTPLAGAKISVKAKAFPLRASREIKGAEAKNIAQNIFENEVKYGLAKLVGVEKAQTIPGEIILPDPQDTSVYNKSSFVSALKACEKDLVSSSKDQKLLEQASELLR